MKTTLLRLATERRKGVRMYRGLRLAQHTGNVWIAPFLKHGVMFWWDFHEHRDGYGGLSFREHRDRIKGMVHTLVRQQLHHQPEKFKEAA